MLNGRSQQFVVVVEANERRPVCRKWTKMRLFGGRVPLFDVLVVRELKLTERPPSSDGRKVAGGRSVIDVVVVVM